jgi:ABC-type lipoprotein export system ATPase subunit
VNAGLCSVELVKVCKTYGGAVPTQVLFDVDMIVHPGEFVAVVGASGSGKTTLLNMIGLLDTPTSGEIRICGRNVGNLDEDERSELRRSYIGYVFQLFYLLPEFTVLENAMLPCLIQRCQNPEQTRDRVVELLRAVGLGERLNFRPSQLSGGQQQRVALVRALSNDPTLVLADEPTGTLDSKSGRAVFDLMRELSRSMGKALLMVTHDEGFAREADRVVKIVDGRIAET